MSSAVLSRTLRTLERKELVWLYAANLEERHEVRVLPSNCAVKFAGLTSEGRKVVDALSANKSLATKLALTGDAWCGWNPQ
jgi:DNA-binding HxlR family transcriptional regulator